MEKDKIITFRVPVELAEKMKNTAGVLDISVGEFIKNRIDYFYSPPPTLEPEIRYVDKIVEVEKIVEKEVIKEVMIDREGTVIEDTDDVIKLDPKVYAEFRAKKLESVPMQSHVNSWIWDSMERTKQYYERKFQQPATPINGNPRNTMTPPQNGNSVSGETKFGMFEEYRRRKREDCFSDDDWKNLKKEIENDPNLTVKQKKVIIEYN